MKPESFLALETTDGNSHLSFLLFGFLIVFDTLTKAELRGWIWDVRGKYTDW